MHSPANSPDPDEIHWLPVLTVLTSTAGLVGAVWMALSCSSEFVVPSKCRRPLPVR